MDIYVGSYEAAGVFRVAFDEKKGQFNSVNKLADLKEVKYLDYNQGLLVCLSKEGKGGISILKGEQIIASYHYETKTSCHVYADHEFIYTANYHEGLLSKLSFQTNKLTVVQQLDLGPKAGLHQVIGYKGHLLVFCLKLNEMRLYTQDLELVNSINFPVDSGPRHGVFNKEKNRLYVLSETSQELYHFKVEGLSFKLIEVISILNDKDAPTHEASAIRLSENEQWLYASSRKVNLISVINVEPEKIQLKQVFGLDYDHPRDIVLATDHYLVVAFRDSNCVVSYALEKGLITGEIDKIEINNAVSLVLGEKYE